MKGEAISYFLGFSATLWKPTHSPFMNQGVNGLSDDVLSGKPTPSQALTRGVLKSGDVLPKMSFFLLTTGGWTCMRHSDCYFKTNLFIRQPPAHAVTQQVCRALPRPRSDSKQLRVQLKAKQASCDGSLLPEGSSRQQCTPPVTDPPQSPSLPITLPPVPTFFGSHISPVGNWAWSFIHYLDLKYESLCAVFVNKFVWG